MCETDKCINKPHVFWTESCPCIKLITSLDISSYLDLSTDSVFATDREGLYKMLLIRHISYVTRSSEISHLAKYYFGICSHMLICLQKCVSNHETKQSSSFRLSDPSPNCFTNDVWNINYWLSTVFYFLIFIFVSHFTRVP